MRSDQLERRAIEVLETEACRMAKSYLAGGDERKRLLDHLYKIDETGILPAIFLLAYKLKDENNGFRLLEIAHQLDAKTVKIIMGQDGN